MVLSKTQMPPPFTMEHMASFLQTDRYKNKRGDSLMLLLQVYFWNRLCGNPVLLSMTASFNFLVEALQSDKGPYTLVRSDVDRASLVASGASTVERYSSAISSIYQAMDTELLDANTLALGSDYSCFQYSHSESPRANF